MSAENDTLINGLSGRTAGGVFLDLVRMLENERKGSDSDTARRELLLTELFKVPPSGAGRLALIAGGQSYERQDISEAYRLVFAHEIEGKRNEDQRKYGTNLRYRIGFPIRPRSTPGGV